MYTVFFCLSLSLLGINMYLNCSKEKSQTGTQTHLLSDGGVISTVCGSA